MHNFSGSFPLGDSPPGLRVGEPLADAPACALSRGVEGRDGPGHCPEPSPGPSAGWQPGNPPQGRPGRSKGMGKVTQATLGGNPLAANDDLGLLPDPGPESLTADQGEVGTPASLVNLCIKCHHPLDTHGLVCTALELFFVCSTKVSI